MVRSCAATSCRNRFKRKTEDGDSITFHQFPKGLEKAQSWLDAIRRRDLTLDKIVKGSYSLCSQHFVEEDFVPYGQRRKLEEFAVPSVFPTHILRRLEHQDQRGGDCVAYNCIYSTLTRNQKENIPLHKIPKDPARKRQWAIAIRRKADDGTLWVPWVEAHLCSLHFREEDMDRTGQTIRLREGAVPSLFNYSQPDIQNKRRLGNKCLLSEKELKEILEEDFVCATAENKPTEEQTELSQSPPSDSFSSRPVTRNSAHVRQLSTNHRSLSEKLGKTRSGKAPPGKAKTSLQPDHRYSQPQSDSSLSEDDANPGEIGGASSPEPPPSPSVTAPEPLQLPCGRLTVYLAGIKNKHHRLRYLQKTFYSLLDKVQFRNSHDDWWSEKWDKSTPLLTLRHERHERDPLLAPVAVLSEDTLLPLNPNGAWKAVSALREQVLDLQLALMNSRIQTLDVELRLQETKAIHRRYKDDVREERKQTEQSHRGTVREVEKRAHEPCTVCPELRRKLAVVERVANKRVRRAEVLGKRLEKIFTPMQIRVLRTGKKGRWVEEDIRRAIKLKKYVSHRGYSYIRQGMGIPLPTTFVLNRGVERYESLRSLYDEMLVENKRKACKSKTGNNTHSPVTKKTAWDEVPRMTSLEPASVERPLVKRRKKRLLAQSPSPREPHGHGYEVVVTSHDAPAGGVTVHSSEASSYRSPGTGRERGMDTAQLRWMSRNRAWEMDDEESIDDEALEEMTRPRETHSGRSWPSSASELR